jgi:hypothetical protein
MRRRPNNDEVLRLEWFRQRFDDEDPYALPPDILLSVEDAKRLWGR